jgi:ABC-type branched-subunit amino acid transport system substrate-binding protein
MKNLISRLEAIQRGGPQLVAAILGIGGLTAVLLIAAVVGALTVGDDKKPTDTNVAAGATTTTAATLETVAPGSETTVPGAETTAAGAPAQPGTTAKPGAKTTTTKPGAAGGVTPNVTEKPPAAGEAPLPKGGSTVGVTDKAIKYGVHIPLTFNKAPVPLGGPVARGIVAYKDYLNANGGINGRALDLVIRDDEFTTDGAATAGKALINDDKVFFIAGTLGVDQIATVADQANKAGVPYFAGGGNEPQFKNLNVHQILSTYDTHVIKLAQFMGKEPMYKGKKVGVIVSDTPLINPSVPNIFRDELKKNGMELVAVEKVQKPEFQNATGYGTIILNFNSKGVEVVVPLTDPINTSGLVRECQTQGCKWTYSFSDFAHDGETALTLFADKWGELKVKGLSGGCYANAPAAQINDPAKCGSMGIAKTQFEKVKGAGSWTATQSDEYGASAGYNSAAGYQWIGFWSKAMKDLGTEVSRERLVASVNRYEGYADLITGPITYKNGAIAHGADKMTVYEAQTGNKYKMVTDGFVDGF